MSYAHVYYLCMVRVCEVKLSLSFTVYTGINLQTGHTVHDNLQKSMNMHMQTFQPTNLTLATYLL